MPLQEPVSRRAIHRRDLALRGYRRDDGLWDLEGRLTDVKDELFQVAVGPQRQPGDMIHDIWVRITCDLDYQVVAATTISDTTPYAECQTVRDAIGKLVGLNLLRGWRRAVSERMSGVTGCLHLTEVLNTLPSLAVQSLVAYRRHLPEPTRADGTPVLFESCRGYAATSAATLRRWPSRAVPRADGAADAAPGGPATGNAPRGTAGS